MNTEESKMLIRRMKAAWPSLFRENDVERIQLLAKTFEPYTMMVANAVVNRLIYELDTPPSLARLAQALKAHNPVEQTAGRSCDRCENTGWIFVSNEGHGTTRRCACNGSGAQTHDNPSLTSEGYPVATKEQKIAGILKGYRKVYPDATDKQILEVFGVARG